MMHPQPPRWLVVSTLSLLLLGCVPKGKHELVQVQLDATRTAMSARTAASIEQTNALSEKVAALEDEVAARQLQLDALSAHIARLEVDLEAQRAAYAKWATTELPPWPEPKTRRPPPEPEEVKEVRAALSAAMDDIEAALALAEAERIRVQAIQDHHDQVVEAFAEITREGWGEVRAEPDHSVVVIGVNKLYQEGKVVPSPLGEMIMGRVAVALRTLEGRLVTIEGHTDDVPRNSLQYPSNWELGFGYAVNVLRTLMADGIPMQPTAASFAGTRPLDPADTDEARKRNRRVELAIRPDPTLVDRFEPTPPDAPDGEGDGAGDGDTQEGDSGE